MKKKSYVTSLFILITLLLSGCMYPEEERAKNQIPYEDEINRVQTAIKQYQDETGGLLPIKTTEEDTPLFQKYPIDFKKLVPKYMAEYPSNAFESGGVFQYVLIDVEDDPKVKLSDLRIADEIRDITLRIRMEGYPPYKDNIGENVYSLDFSKIGYNDEPKAVSPFSGNELSYVVTTDGEVFVDYRTDLMQLMEAGDIKAENNDIRFHLVEDSPFVPSYSLPYTIDQKKNEPIFLVN